MRGKKAIAAAALLAVGLAATTAKPARAAIRRRVRVDALTDDPARIMAGDTIAAAALRSAAARGLTPRDPDAFVAAILANAWAESRWDSMAVGRANERGAHQLHFARGGLGDLAVRAGIISGPPDAVPLDRATDVIVWAITKDPRAAAAVRSTDDAGALAAALHNLVYRSAGGAQQAALRADFARKLLP